MTNDDFTITMYYYKISLLHNVNLYVLLPLLQLLRNGTHYFPGQLADVDACLADARDMQSHSRQGHAGTRAQRTQGHSLDRYSTETHMDQEGQHLAVLASVAVARVMTRPLKRTGGAVEARRQSAGTQGSTRIRP